MSEEQRCKTCAHWGGGHRYSSRWPDKNDPDFRDDWGDCRLVNDAEHDPKAGIVAYYCDSAYFTTAPDFGCVQWEAKP